ncbi:MAG: hypothetical protein A2V70_12265, partial [Planctomycetes bacterium RBG_13_63_9]
DPRAPGGGVSGTAILATGPISVDAYTRITARVYQANHGPTNQGYIPTGDDWSAPAVGEYFVNALVGPADVVITEINYHPLAPTAGELATQPLEDPDYESDDFEFVELKNVSGHTVNIRGVRFMGGMEFTFGSHVLADGELIVVVEDLEGFTARYGIEGSLEGTGITVAGAWKGELDNKGEQLTVLGRDGSTLLDFAYDDGGDWPGRADGNGSSLELQDPSAVPSTPLEGTAYLEDPAHWRSSIDVHGSPCAAGSEPSTTVLINEVLAHSDLPHLDRIELVNTTQDAIDIAGWYLSDSSANYFKFAIPPDAAEGTTRWLLGGQYAVFDERDFNLTGLDADPSNDDPNDFALSSFGDDVWLLSVDEQGKPGRFVDRVEFGATLTNVSVGRLSNGNPDSDLLPLAGMSFGTANTAHRVGEVIVSEVHYNPAGSDDDREFIELYNGSGASVDLSHWRIADAVDLEIPEGTTLGMGEALVLVGFDPEDSARAAAFRTEHGVGTAVPLIGPWDPEDVVDNGGEKITLQKRNDELEPGKTEYAYITVDQVDFDDDPPWPDADANGSSLTRLAPGNFGNDPAGWTATRPTPGVAFSVVWSHVFYNNSYWDTPTAENPHFDDDTAIAPDKAALRRHVPSTGYPELDLPYGQATSGNYTNSSRGINGIMVDVSDLPPAAEVIDPDDYFEFRVGNDDTPTGWMPYTVEPAVDVRTGEGDFYSDRLTLIWPDYDPGSPETTAVANGWLQVTVLANEHTGLVEPEVFYFGNAIGETGDSITHARVDANDILQTRNNPHPFFDPAAINCPYDFNRDARVDAYDVVIARNNQTTYSGELHLIDLSGSKASVPATHPATRLDTAEKAPVDSRTSAHDAVLERTVQRRWSRSTRPQSTMDWLWQFESVGLRERSARSIEPAERAVDLLLTAGIPSSGFGEIHVKSGRAESGMSGHDFRGDG